LELVRTIIQKVDVVADVVAMSSFDVVPRAGVVKHMLWPTLSASCCQQNEMWENHGAIRAAADDTFECQHRFWFWVGAQAPIAPRVERLAAMLTEAPYAGPLEEPDVKPEKKVQPILLL
jgi:hypothetical protein